MARKAAWGESAEAELPQFFCSSDDFQRLIRQDHPQWLVPESAIVYMGHWLPWFPQSEEPHPPGVPCPHRAKIRPGSLLACPSCQLSGFERQLSEQRRLAGYPPPEAPQRTPAPPRPAPPPSTAPKPTADPKRQAMWQTFAWARPPSSLAKPKNSRRSA